MTTLEELQAMTDEQLIIELGTKVMGWGKMPIPWWMHILLKLTEEDPPTFCWKMPDDPSVWHWLHGKKWNPLEDADTALWVAAQAQLPRKVLADAFLQGDTLSDTLRAICIAALLALQKP